MAGIIIPGQTQGKSITLQTREGKDIPNNQSFETTLWEEHQLQTNRRRYPHVEFRTGAIPIYNCHGLTFASRRSRIWQTPAVQDILRDDHYEQVSQDEVQPGDIILYISADDGDFEHSGVVVEPPTAPLFVPRVWSKWGSGAEAVHFANDCPYDFSQARYYRIRS